MKKLITLAATLRSTIWPSLASGQNKINTVEAKKFYNDTFKTINGN